MNGEFRIGDKVRSQVGVIKRIDADGLPYIRWPDDSCNWVYAKNLELVERPEKKATIEFTESELRRLIVGFGCRDVPDIEAKIRAAFNNLQ